MGCFLVMTKKDFEMMQMMNRASKQEKPAFDKMRFISDIINPKTHQKEVMVRVGEAKEQLSKSEAANLAKAVRSFFPETRRVGDKTWETPQSHHIFPQKHIEFFQNKANINIHEWTVQLDAKSHASITKEWERSWDKFIENHTDNNPEQTRQDAIRFAGQLMTAFGLGSDVRTHRTHPK